MWSAVMVAGSSIFDYVEKRSCREKNFATEIIKSYEKYNFWSLFFVRAVTVLGSRMRRPKKKSTDYFFWGDKYKFLIRTLPKDKVCIIGGPAQLLFCLRNGVGFIPCFDMRNRNWDLLLEGMRNKISQEKVGRDLSERLSGYIRPYASNGSFIILNNDSLPMQRAVILASRMAGVKKAICVQHGLFQSGTEKHVIDGWFCDKLFAINESQKQIMIAKGIDSEKIKVMGLHSPPFSPKRQMSRPESRAVCFLGQPWGRYDKSLEERYITLVRKIFSLLSDNKIAACYKPHPMEDDLVVKKINGKPFRGDLVGAIEKFDVFVSMTSTALLEARLSGRLAVQILDVNFIQDDFSEMEDIVSIKSSESDFERALVNSICGVAFSKAPVEQVSEKFRSLLREQEKS